MIHNYISAVIAILGTAAGLLQAPSLEWELSLMAVLVYLGWALGEIGRR